MPPFALAVRRALPLAALTLVAATPLTSRRADVADGVRFVYRLTSDGRQQSAQQVQVRVADGNLRMDWLDGAMGPEFRGSYAVIQGTSGQIKMVNTRNKEVFVVDPGAMASMAQMAGGLVKVELLDPTLDVEDLGAGETMLGSATRRYRVTESYTVRATILGRATTSKQVSVSELWIARDLVGFGKAMEQWAEAFGRGIGRNFGGAVQGDGMKRMMDLSRAKWPQGVPLKNVTTVTSTDGKDPNKTTTSTSTMEITEFARADVDPAIFAIPADYKVTDLGATMRAAEAEMAREGQAPGRGAAATDSAKAAAKDDAKDQAKEAAKDAIKGLFRRKP